MMHDFRPDDLIQQVKLIEIKRRKRTIIVTSVAVLFFLSYLLYTVSVIKKNNNDKNAEQTLNDSLVNRIAQLDSAKKNIYSYFEYQNKSDTLGIFNLLADTLLRYYILEKPIAKSELRTSKYFEINQNGKYVVDSNFTVLKIKDTLYALIKTPVYGGGVIWNRLHEIKMNNTYQIFYVRAYDLNSEKVKNKFGIN